MNCYQSRVDSTVHLYFVKKTIHIDQTWKKKDLFASAKTNEFKLYSILNMEHFLLCKNQTILIEIIYLAL